MKISHLAPPFSVKDENQQHFSASRSAATGLSHTAEPLHSNTSGSNLMSMKRIYIQFHMFWLLLNEKKCCVYIYLAVVCTVYTHVKLKPHVKVNLPQKLRCVQLRNKFISLENLISCKSQPPKLGLKKTDLEFLIFTSIYSSYCEVCVFLTTCLLLPNQTLHMNFFCSVSAS